MDSLHRKTFKICGRGYSLNKFTGKATHPPSITIDEFGKMIGIIKNVVKIH